MALSFIRRPVMRRLVALVAALPLVGRLAVHECPMHDGPPLRAAVAATPAVDHSAHAAHAAHAATAAVGPDASAAPAGHGEHRCTCASDCASLDRTAVLASQPSAIVAVVTRQPVVAPRAPERTPHARLARLLPFANGPPAASSARA